jgi:hypothetical protein
LNEYCNECVLEHDSLHFSERLAPALMAKALKTKALNPAFRWEGDAEAPQVAWSFGGAAADVSREHAELRTTSIDAKIARVVAQRPGGRKEAAVTGKKSAAAPARPAPPASRAAAAAAAPVPVAADSDSESDAALDGELDESSDGEEKTQPDWDAAADDSSGF